MGDRHKASDVLNFIKERLQKTLPSINTAISKKKEHSDTKKV